MTTLDQKKKEADFRLLQVSPYVVRWQNGKQETVNKRQLNKLQNNHPNWMTDF